MTLRGLGQQAAKLLVQLHGYPTSARGAAEEMGMIAESGILEDFGAAVVLISWPSSGPLVLASVPENSHATASVLSSVAPIAVVENNASWEHGTPPCWSTSCTEVAYLDPGA
jgi:hypothetical protein